MARMTRSQRKARRQAQAASAAGQSSQSGGAASRVAQVRPQPAAVKTQTGAKRKEERGTRSFVVESWGELKKVEWPTQSHVMQGTVVVLIACAIVGTYIWIADIAFRNLVQDIFLR